MKTSYSVKTSPVNFFKFLCFIIPFLDAPIFSQTIKVTLPDSIAAPAAKTEWRVKVRQYCEGPIYQAKDSSMLFTEQKGNGISDWPIWKVSLNNIQDSGAVFIFNAGQANGMEMDPQGRLVIASNAKLLRYKFEGTLDTILAQPAAPADFNQINDLSIQKNGGIYFTDLSTRVFFLSPTRKLSVVSTGLQSANGVQIIEETKTAFVDQSGKDEVTQFDIQSDGSFSNPRPFVSVPIPDGLEIDSHGNFYIASYGEGAVFVFDVTGKPLGKIELTPVIGFDSRSGKTGNVSNCAFGGPDFKTLFITGDGGLYSVQLKIAGRPRLAASATLMHRRNLFNEDARAVMFKTSVFSKTGSQVIFQNGNKNHNSLGRKY